MPGGSRNTMAVLEIGCGRNRDPRATHRLDANPNVFTETELAGGNHKIGDALRLPWDDATFDTVLAIDVLEHIPYRRTLDALDEWRRVMSPKGKLYVQVPDAGRIMQDYVACRYARDQRLPTELQNHPPIMSATWRIMGGQDDGTITTEGDDWALNLHCSMFDEQLLRWFAERAGFKVESLESNPHPNLCAWLTAS